MVAALSVDQVELLNQVMVDQAVNGLPQCRYRGCVSPGKYYLRRSLKHGIIQTGMYCDECDERFGEQNLRRAARAMGGKVITLTDEDGDFRGIQVCGN